MIKTVPLFSLRDISIIPAVKTMIGSRQECDPFCDNLEGNNKFYPLITAPMSCLLSTEKTLGAFEQEKINTIVPRTFPYSERWELCKKRMTAFSLSEAEDIFYNKTLGDREHLYILLDMANGHMISQLEIGRLLKKKYGEDLVLMGGNIANPFTYIEYEKSGFDFVRCGIGGGAGCLTSTQIGIHYPMGSLLSEIRDIRNSISGRCKIVADGGIGSYSEIIKALALGADYVMMGQVFTKAAIPGQQVGDLVSYYGMSTKTAQKEMGATKLKTAEGKSINIHKEYTLSGWTENFRDYLRSAMSYCDCRNLDDFKNKTVCNLITPSSAAKINDK